MKEFINAPQPQSSFQEDIITFLNPTGAGTDQSLLGEMLSHMFE